jgi:hypothetical protein
MQAHQAARRSKIYVLALKLLVLCRLVLPGSTMYKQLYSKFSAWMMQLEGSVSSTRKNTSLLVDYTACFYVALKLASSNMVSARMNAAERQAGVQTSARSVHHIIDEALLSAVLVNTLFWDGQCILSSAVLGLGPGRQTNTKQCRVGYIWSKVCLGTHFGHLGFDDDGNRCQISG